MEKRHGRRFNVNWAVYIGHPTCGFVLGKTINVSLSGIAFLSGLRYPVYDQISLQIEVSPMETIRCVGQIVREKSTSAGKYSYSVRLLRFSGNDRRTYSDKLLELRRVELAPETAA
jgi:hypothetical protein